MSFVVETAKADDRDAVVALWQVCGLVVSYNDPHADFDLAIGGASSTVLVARDDQRTIIGALMVGHDGHRGWLYYVGSDPALQRTGIGRRLVSAAEDWLGQRGIPKVQLMVRQSNTKVFSFYEKLGYDETPRVVMAKWLKEPGT
ncbi:MAG: GNAT family acetyltransferase [Rhizobiaceae bacterium]